jgi:hypothetical protein
MHRKHLRTRMRYSRALKRLKDSLATLPGGWDGL